MNVRPASTPPSSVTQAAQRSAVVLVVLALLVVSVLIHAASGPKKVSRIVPDVPEEPTSVARVVSTPVPGLFSFVPRVTAATEPEGGAVAEGVSAPAAVATPPQGASGGGRSAVPPGTASPQPVAPTVPAVRPNGQPSKAQQATGDAHRPAHAFAEGSPNTSSTNGNKNGSAGASSNGNGSGH